MRSLTTAAPHFNPLLGPGPIHWFLYPGQATPGHPRICPAQHLEAFAWLSAIVVCQSAKMKLAIVTGILTGPLLVSAQLHALAKNAGLLYFGTAVSPSD